MQYKVNVHVQCCTLCCYQGCAIAIYTLELITIAKFNAIYSKYILELNMLIFMKVFRIPGMLYVL